MCEGGAYVNIEGRTWLVGVSLLQSPTQAYKGNENVLLTRVTATDKIRGKGDQSEKDAIEVCDGCVRRKGHTSKMKGPFLTCGRFII